MSAEKEEIGIISVIFADTILIRRHCRLRLPNTGTGEASMADLLYLKLSESCLADRKKVKIKDVATVQCRNPDIKYGVEKLEVMSFTGTREQQVVSVMYILELIQKSYPDCLVELVGATDVVIYYRSYDASDTAKQMLKFVMVCLIAFLGAGFSIMSYNSDVNMAGQLDVMENIFVGQNHNSYPVAGIAYSVGLFIGIIVFFNHGARKKFTDDPTPLQVQMRQYEQEVNQTIITDADRKNESRE